MLVHSLRKALGLAAFAAVLTTATLTAGTAAAAEPTKEQMLGGVEQMLGFVPTFLTQMPAASLPVGLAGYTHIETGETVLDAKTKYLISLAVAAQIPCQYCIWADTLGARAAGASDEEIGEAVGVAAMTRFWSTNFNGLQVDLDLYKRELAPLYAKR